MGKIIEQIEGYDKMTPEAKLAALEAMEMPAEAPQPDTELANKYGKVKNALDKQCHENAELTKQLRELRTAEQNAKADAEAREREKDERLAAYERREKESSLAEGLVKSLGVDIDTAKEIAKARLSDDFETEFKLMSAHRENLAKAAVTKAMQSQSGISSGAPVGGGSGANDDDLSDAEWFAKHPLTNY